MIKRVYFSVPAKTNKKHKTKGDCVYFSELSFLELHIVVTVEQVADHGVLFTLFGRKAIGMWEFTFTGLFSCCTRAPEITSSCQYPKFISNMG